MLRWVVSPSYGLEAIHSKILSERHMKQLMFAFEANHGVCAHTSCDNVPLRCRSELPCRQVCQPRRSTTCKVMMPSTTAQCACIVCAVYGRWYSANKCELAEAAFGSVAARRGELGN